MVYFDETYYLQSKLAQLKNIGESYHPDGETWNATNLKAFMLEQGMTPQEHYLRYGRSEGLDPNPYFNEAEYLQSKTNQLNSVRELKPGADTFSNWTVADTLKAITDAGMLPVEHYERYGAFETSGGGDFINPSSALDTSAYWSAKLSQLQTTEPNGNWTQEKMLEAFQNAGLSPVSHYMRYGEGEAKASGITFVQPALVDVTVTQGVAPHDNSVFVTGTINDDNFVEIALGAEGIVTVLNGTLEGAPALGSGGTLNASVVMGGGELWLFVDSDFSDEGAVILGSATALNSLKIEGVIGNFNGGNDADSIEVYGNGYIDDIRGGFGHDSINIVGGNAGAIFGDFDNDTITVVSGGTVTDRIGGGEGDDNITVSSEGTVIGNIWGDYYDGDYYDGYGDDKITIDGTVTGNIYGGAGNDIITIGTSATIDGDIYGGIGADTIDVGWQHLKLGYASGDTGKYMPLTPGSGSTINTAQFDVIKGIGSSVSFYEENQSWATVENLSALPTTNPSTDGGIYLVRGAYNESSNTFSAASGGESTLLLFDTDVSTATNFEAVVLVGVPAASVLVDNSTDSFTVNTVSP